MYITYEQRKNRGKIDNEILTEKPTFIFEYAWFLVTDDTAQYVESHGLGVYNKDMTDEMKTEVTAFYNNYVREPDIKPTYDSDTQKLIEDGTEIVDGLTYKKYKVESLPQVELDARVVVPDRITLRQAREQLIIDGLFSSVETAIESIQDATQKAITRNYWEYSQDFTRDNPILIALATSLGLTDTQLDTLFINASKL